MLRCNFVKGKNALRHCICFTLLNLKTKLNIKTQNGAGGITNTLPLYIKSKKQKLAQFESEQNPKWQIEVIKVPDLAK